MTEPVSPAAVPAVSRVGRQARLAEIVSRTREFSLIVVIGLLVLVTSLISRNFLRSTDIQFVLLNTSIMALLVVGETLVMVTFNYDISVQSVVGISAYLCASLFPAIPGIPIPVVFLIGLGIGMVCGAINGLLVTVAKVSSVVVTLATMYIFFGVDIIIVGGNQVVASSLPQSFVNIGRSTLLGIPVLAIAVAVVIGAVAYYMRSFRSGRELYAIGSNADAARLAGIPSGRRVFTAFVASGGCAGLAGVIWAIRYGTINSTAGAGLSIEVIAAAVVGGVAAFGGFGSVVGAALGALLLGTIATALSVLGVSPFWIDALSGVLIIGAISLDRGITVRMARVLRTRRFRDEAAEHEGVNT